MLKPFEVYNQVLGKLEQLVVLSRANQMPTFQTFPLVLCVQALRVYKFVETLID
jgi:hypothetical protein